MIEQVSSVSSLPDSVFHKQRSNIKIRNHMNFYFFILIQQFLVRDFTDNIAFTNLIISYPFEFIIM